VTETEASFNEKHILVVGGAGFVGSNLVAQLLDAGSAQVAVVDNFLSSEPGNIPLDSRVDVRRGSIADESILAGLEDEFDVVFHLATYHGNQSSIANPLDDHANNLLTTLRLFDRLSSFERLGRVVYSSTGCALAEKGEGPAEPVVEDGDVPLDYDSPYQISKVVGEMYALYFGRAHGLPVVRARFQNVYGPGEILGAGEWRGTPATVWRNVVPTFIYRALKGLPLLVHGEGASSRDFIYVGDVVGGLIACATIPGVAGDVFNLASGSEVSILELATQVNRLTGNEAGIQSLSPRSWDRSVHRVGSTEKSEAKLGFRARTSLEAGLATTIEWTQDNLATIDACIDRHRERLEPGMLV
jgi:nucleoside-diphosphate-sugar epimerase